MRASIGGGSERGATVRVPLSRLPATCNGSLTVTLFVSALSSPCSGEEDSGYGSLTFEKPDTVRTVGNSVVPLDDTEVRTKRVRVRLIRKYP